VPKPPPVYETLNDNDRLTIYNDPYWQEALDSLDRCCRCNERCEKLNYIGCCRDCWGIVKRRLWVLSLKNKKKACPYRPLDWINYKGDLRRDNRKWAGKAQIVREIEKRLEKGKRIPIKYLKKTLGADCVYCCNPNYIVCPECVALI
jgi:hypothetical protein